MPYPCPSDRTPLMVFAATLGDVVLDSVVLAEDVLAAVERAAVAIDRIVALKLHVRQLGLLLERVVDEHSVDVGPPKFLKKSDTQRSGNSRKRDTNRRTIGSALSRALPGAHTARHGALGLPQPWHVPSRVGVSSIPNAGAGI